MKRIDTRSCCYRLVPIDMAMAKLRLDLSHQQLLGAIAFCLL
jgi:hypothetical protein